MVLNQGMKKRGSLEMDRPMVTGIGAADCRLDRIKANNTGATALGQRLDVRGQDIGGGAHGSGSPIHKTFQGVTVFSRDILDDAQ